MKKLMITLILMVTFGSPVIALEPMSNDELKKTTAQIGATVGQVPFVYSHGSTVVGIIVKGIDNFKIYDDLSTALGPVGTAQELSRPVIEFAGVANDANDLKSVATFGLF